MSTARELRLYMNMMAFDSFPGSRGTFRERLERLSGAGFSGVQFTVRASSAQLDCCRSLAMGVAFSGRVNSAAEANAFAEQVAGDGYECATLHAGWGLEDDAEAARLIEGILSAVERWRTPLYIETHRATICQDMWRTVQFVNQFPEMRFNGDFSHWYAGQEMVYGGFEKKLEFIRPVLQRVRFLHGRIASPGCIQVAVREDDDSIYVQHFRRLWTEVFRGVASGPIVFAPELLAPDIFYARTFGGVEESDRWEQSLIVTQIARECFQS